MDSGQTKKRRRNNESNNNHSFVDSLLLAMTLPGSMAVKQVGHMLATRPYPRPKSIGKLYDLPMIKAIQTEKPWVVELLLKAKASPDSQSGVAYLSALHSSDDVSDENLEKLLTNIEARRIQLSPLYLALAQQSNAIVKMLLDARAKVTVEHLEKAHELNSPWLDLMLGVATKSEAFYFLEQLVNRMDLLPASDQKRLLHVLAHKKPQQQNQSSNFRMILDANRVYPRSNQDLEFLTELVQHPEVYIRPWDELHKPKLDSKVYARYMNEFLKLTKHDIHFRQWLNVQAEIQKHIPTVLQSLIADYAENAENTPSDDWIFPGTNAYKLEMQHIYGNGNEDEFFKQLEKEREAEKTDFLLTSDAHSHWTRPRDEED